MALGEIVADVHHRAVRRNFVKAHIFYPAYFVIRADGVCRLNPEMARIVVAKVSAWKILDVDRPVLAKELPALADQDQRAIHGLTTQTQ
jgi:hypothetical protein